MTIYRVIDLLKPRAVPDPVYVTATLAEQFPHPKKQKFRNGIQGMLQKKQLGYK